MFSICCRVSVTIFIFVHAQIVAANCLRFFTQYRSAVEKMFGHAYPRERPPRWLLVFSRLNPMLLCPPENTATLSFRFIFFIFLMNAGSSSGVGIPPHASKVDHRFTNLYTIARNNAASLFCNET